MNYKRAREALKPRLRDYVESITEKSKGANMYVCPLCGSGKGRNHTGAFSIDPKEPTRFKCFSCGESGDIFDLIGAVENIPEPLDQLKKAGELYGIDLEREYTHMNIHTEIYTHKDTQEKDDLILYYRKCQSHIKETDYPAQRGLSEEVIKRFMLGYEPDFKKAGKHWKALIIPTGRYSYVARNTDLQAEEKDRYINDRDIEIQRK